MPLYAGVCETDITPPIGVRLTEHGGVSRSTAVHDPLYARALVLDNGLERLAIVVADLFSISTEVADDIRADIAAGIATRPEAVLICCSGTAHGPDLEPAGCDAAYLDILKRKIVGATIQAASALEAVYLTYGETSAQIGVSSLPGRSGDEERNQANYGGPVAAAVQAVCINAADGKLLALLFSHACAGSAVSQIGSSISADWPGAACERLKSRFRNEEADSGVREGALPLFLAGCGADVRPIRQGSWDLVRSNGAQIGDAAHAARWNAHGRQDETLAAGETVVQLSGARVGVSASLTISWMQLGGIQLLAFPADMSVKFQIDITATCSVPVICVSHANGYAGRGLAASDCPSPEPEGAASDGFQSELVTNAMDEEAIRLAAYRILGIGSEEIAPFPPTPGCGR